MEHNFQILSFLIFSLLFATYFNKTQAHCNAQDKEALLKIKEGFGNPSLLVEYWTNDRDCCDWPCVTCSDTTYRVTEFYLQYYSELTTSIPDAFGDLPYLETLYLRKNPNLTGKIPSTLSKLSHLRSIQLEWNKLTGSIPPIFHDLKNLEYLDLSFNQLTGTIPRQLGFIPKLNYIDLSRNRITGSIPDSLGYLAAQDITLRLSHNQLTGPIPNSLAKPRFTFIDFNRNHLVGDAYMVLNSNTMLRHVDLSRNNLSFDFSLTSYNISYTFYLDVSHNSIYGSIPTQIADLQLGVFNVSYNRLCGKIPTGTGTLKEYCDEFCFLHNKCLCGSPLPPCK